MPVKYSLERIDRNKVCDLIPIYEDAFKTTANIGNLVYKLDTFYSPVSYLGIITYYDTTTACSYYGVYPVFAIINGTKYLISQSGDTMTHSDHVGKGLFYDSANLTYELCKQFNVQGVFGFPSKPSYPGFKKKLNWKFNEKIKKYSFFIPVIPFAYLASKNSFFRKIYNIWIKVLLSFFKAGSCFPGSIVSNRNDGIYRDENYWKYKMRCNDIFIINICNSNVVIKFNGSLSIGDIELDDNTDLKKIIRRLKILAFFSFNTRIVTYLSPNTLIDRKFSEINTHEDGLPIGFLNFSNDVDLAELKFSYFDFDTF